MKKHIEIVHAEHKEHICGSCGKSFSISGNLKAHKKIHDNIGKTVNCNYCDQSFITLTEVAREVGSDRAPKFFLFHPKFRHLMG